MSFTSHSDTEVSVEAVNVAVRNIVDERDWFMFVICSVMHNRPTINEEEHDLVISGERFNLVSSVSLG